VGKSGYLDSESCIGDTENQTTIEKGYIKQLIINKLENGAAGMVSYYINVSGYWSAASLR
jgi:hypothetical protein